MGRVGAVAKIIDLLEECGKLMLSVKRGDPVYLPEVRKDQIWLLVGSPWGLLAVWLLLINLVTFFIFGLDKLKAKRKVRYEAVRRIPERTLFLLAILGGSMGALLGMKMWHHKTLHKTFRFGIPAILFLQLLIPAGLYLYFSVIR